MLCKLEVKALGGGVLAKDKGSWDRSHSRVKSLSWGMQLPLGAPERDGLREPDLVRNFVWREFSLNAYTSCAGARVRELSL